VLSLISMLRSERLPSDIAVAGEITLRGSVLGVSGLKQKCLAAHRAGIKQVVLPRRNEPEIDEVPASVREALTIHFVSRVEEVLSIAFPGLALQRTPEATTHP
jgi:ATP-dependent Lon protease